MAVAVITPDSNPYSVIFHQYIIRSVEYLHYVLRRGDEMMSAESRAQIFHTLSYALKSSDYVASLLPQIYELIGQFTPVMEKAGDVDEWIPYVEKALALSQEIEDHRGTAGLSLQLALLYQIINHLERACACAYISMTIFTALDDRQNQAHALNRLAYIARLQRNFPKATELAHQALHLFEEGNLAREFSYFVLGTTALDEGNWNAAEGYFNRSLAICRRYGANHKIAARYGDLGVALRNQQKYEEAIDCYQKALAILETVSDCMQQAIVRMNLGNVYLLLGEPKRAYELYMLVEAILSNAQDELHLAMLYTNVGIACRMLAWWDQAEESFHKAIGYWQTTGNVINWVNALDEMGLLYLQQNQYMLATNTLQQAEQLLTQHRDDPAYPALYQSLSAHLLDCDQLAQQNAHVRIASAQHRQSVQDAHHVSMASAPEQR